MISPRTPGKRPDDDPERPGDGEGPAPTRPILRKVVRTERVDRPESPAAAEPSPRPKKAVRKKPPQKKARTTKRASKSEKTPVESPPEKKTAPVAESDAGRNGTPSPESPDLPMPAAEKPAETPSDPSGSLAWKHAPSVPQTIRASFGEAIAFANLMVDRAPEHPALSVHEYRKTIRRMRALVRLLRGVIDRDALRSIDTGLRSAVLPTSGLRDARILLATLDRVPPIPGSKHLRHALEDRWQDRIDALEASDEEARVLAESRAPLARLPEELADALPITIEEEELREALRRSFRRARRVCRTAMRVPEDASIHRARKRIKELRYQLEWLVDISTKRIRNRQRACARLAQDLGEVTDLLVLEESILDDRTGLRGLKPRKFCRRLRRILLARFEEVSVEMEALFAEPSRDFVRGVAGKLAQER